MRKAGYGIIVILLISMLVGAPAEGAAGNVKLIKITGSVQVERDDKMMPAKVNMVIEGGDVIVTGKSSEAALDMGGGRVVTVRQGTQFTIDDNRSEGSGGVLNYGIVYVRKTSGSPSAPFSVQTPTAVAGVRGTDFGVSVAPDGSSMFIVENGEIEVETDDGGATKVAGNQEVVVETDEKQALQVQPYDKNRQSLEQWSDERRERILKNPLPTITRLINRIENALGRGEPMLVEADRLADETLEMVKKLDEYKRAGQEDKYRAQKELIAANMAKLRPLVKRLARIDNVIQSQKRLIKTILDEARAQGSPTPPESVKAIEKKIEEAQAVKERSRQLHRGRRNLMRNKVSVIRKSIAENRGG